MTVTIDGAAVASAANSDPQFRYTARDWTATIQFAVDDEVTTFAITDGQISVSDATEADVRISGPEAQWERMLQQVPPPGATILVVTEGMVVTGDMVAHTGPYGPAIYRLMRVTSELINGAAEIIEVPTYPFKDTDNTVGQYVYYEVDGVEYRVYYETAGQGIPLLLQHTAGADARQWRHLLADPAMQAKYQMIAYDLPYHGRSLPPTHGVKWWEKDYEVSKADLHQRVVGLKRALGLDRPIFMGVSVGGQLAPELVGYFPDDFRGAISVNGWYSMEGWEDFPMDKFHHPRIHQDQFAGMNYEATSPYAPEPFRRETAWVYASGGPAVYKGDNEYFAWKHDLREDGHLVDTSRTPLAVVACEYDMAFDKPNGSEAIAENIPGSTYHVLEGMSHFAMHDDPVRFNRAIAPILDQVAEGALKIAQG